MKKEEIEWFVFALFNFFTFFGIASFFSWITGAPTWAGYIFALVWILNKKPPTQEGK